MAEGDKTQLRQLVTPAVFSDMKRQMKQREEGGWARVHWEMARVRGACCCACRAVRAALRRLLSLQFCCDACPSCTCLILHMLPAAARDEDSSIC